MIFCTPCCPANGGRHRPGGNPGQAAAQPRQTPTIYERIGVPAAKRVRQTLQEHQLLDAAPDTGP